MSLLAFQKLIHKKLQKDLLVEKYSSKEIEKYKKTVDISKKKNITEEDLFLKIFEKKIVFVGDFHSYSQYQETFYRIINRSILCDSDFCVALEMFYVEDQDTLSEYLSGKISEEKFLKKINYEKKWAFPWSNYRKIIDFCKINKIKIYALNCQGDLLERDDFARKHIDKIHKKEKKIFVLYGEMHLHKSKIPKGIDNSLTIHQNLFDIQKGRFFSLDASNYCILTTPLWIKFCTEVLWLDRDFSEDFSRFFIKKNLKNPEDSLYDVFYSISQVLVSFLQLKTKSSLENYTIYNMYEEKNFSKKIKEKDQKKIFLLHVKNNLAFSYDFNYYSCDLSFDSLCVLVADHVVRSCVLTIKKKDFNTYFLENFYSYLFSKIINPFRRTLLYGDLLEKKYIYTHETINFLISGKENFKSEEEKYFVARYLGFLVGEYFFLKFSSSQKNFLSEFLKIKKKNYKFILKEYLPKNFKEDRHHSL